MPEQVLVLPGDVLAGRYHVLCAVPVPGDATATLWQARDEVLARPVAVKVLPAREPAAAGFLEAAARAGAVEAQPLARVYDAAVEPRRQRPSLAYVLSEWVEGESLAVLLAAGPLPFVQALEAAVEAAQALAALHAAGAVHGRLHPGNALVSDDGPLRLTDAEVGGALHLAGGALPERRPLDDLRDLGALLYAMVTARWPQAVTPQPARGLAAAPRTATGVCSPRQVRAGVPRPLDALVMRLLLPADGARPLSATTVLPELERVLDDVRRREREAGAGRGEHPGGPQRPGRLRRVAPALAGLALLVVLGAAAFSLGLSVGELPALEDNGPPKAPPTAAAPAAGGPVDLTRAVVRDFDPFGSPPTEKPDQVPLAYDGAASTAWTTELYRTPGFGGLKPGVGLLLDLGAPTALAEVQVDLTRAGTGLELRAGDTLGADQGSLAVVASDPGSSDVVRLAVPAGTTARYWLVWVTRLPADGGQFRAGIDELRLLRA